jgi:hypothetical protein
MVLMRNGGEYTTSPPRFEMVQKGYLVEIDWQAISRWRGRTPHSEC